MSEYRRVRFRVYARPELTNNLLAYFRVNGKQHYRSTGTPLLNEAIRRVETMIDELLDPKPVQRLLQDLVVSYWEELQRSCVTGRRKPPTLRVYLPRLRRFLAFCHCRGVRTVDGLTVELLNAYRAYLREERGFSARTVGSEFASTVSGLVKRAYKLGWLAEDVTRKLEREKPPEHRKRPFERDEIAAIWRALRRDPRGRERVRPLRLLLWTGVRTGQACALTWADVDLKRRRARLVPQKADPEPRELVLPPRVVRMLRSIPQKGSPRVFEEATEKRLLTWLRWAGREAGVREPFRVHDLRSSFICWAGNDPRCQLRIQDIAAQVGHSDLATTMGYFKTDLAQLEKKLATLR